MSLELRIPEEQFMQELCHWLNERVIVPVDGNWHEITMTLEIRADDGQERRGIQGFMLGGGNAG